MATPTRCVMFETRIKPVHALLEVLYRVLFVAKCGIVDSEVVTVEFIISNSILVKEMLIMFIV